MKNLFLALALTGFVGAASLNTVSAFAPSKVITGGGEECKKDKKCKKGAECCKTKTATTSNDKKCSQGEAKKCCSSAKATTAKSATTSEGNTMAKPVDAK